MRIATWNINGVKARLDSALGWLRHASPDVVCLQEIKSVDEGFPGQAFEELGYNVAVHGQKGFNGVALLSKLPLEDVTRGLPGGPEDQQARLIAATVATKSTAVRIVSLYLPNGNPLATDKYAYKLAWLERLQAWAAARLDDEMPLVMAGDYNIIPEPVDARRPEAWTGDALFQPEVRAHYRRLIGLGLLDAVRAACPEPGVYTFWDYQAGSWPRDDGIRIDHLLLSPQASDCLTGAGVDRGPRGAERPSDHTPAWVDLAV